MWFDAYYSDPHFIHRNVIQYCNRPFNDVDNQIYELMRRYNSVVRPEHHTLWVGDCYFPKDIHGFLSRFNGKKTLVRGNHDRRLTDPQLLRAGFDAVYPMYFTSTMDGMPVRYSHFPWDGYSHDRRYPSLRPPRETGVALIHGHTHEKDRLTKNGTVHVGVDAWNYSPATHKEVADLVRQVLSIVPVNETNLDVVVQDARSHSSSTD